MKVIHFIAGIDKKEGGTAEYMRLLGSELKNHVEIVVATGISANPITIAGVTIKFFKTNVLRWFSMLKEFKLFLQAENPDIVHINGVWSPQNWGFQKVAQELGMKVILSPRNVRTLDISSKSLEEKIRTIFISKKSHTKSSSFARNCSNGGR